MAKYPKDWQICPIGQLALLKAGKDRFETSLCGGPYPWYGGNGIRGYSSHYSYDGIFPIVGRQGEWCGNVKLAKGRFSATEHAVVVTCKDGVLPEYLYFSLSFANLNQYATGCAQPGLSVRKIEAIPIAKPPFDEQRRIVEALESIDKLIDNLARRIEKKRMVKQGVMQELLTGKKRLPGITGLWGTSRLADVAEFSTTSIASSRVDPAWYVGTDTMLPDGGGVVPNVAVVPYANIREYIVGDVLISNIRPYLKKIWLSNRHGGCSTDVLVVRGNPDYVTPKFLYFVLSDDKFFKFVMANAIGTKMPRGDKQVIMTYEFQVPPLPEQEAIAAALGYMDAEIEALDAKREKYERIKQGMMHDLLTGKVRI